MELPNFVQKKQKNNGVLNYLEIVPFFIGLKYPLNITIYKYPNLVISGIVYWRFWKVLILYYFCVGINNFRKSLYSQDGRYKGFTIW